MEMNKINYWGHWRQECDCDFITSGRGVIDGLLLEKKESSVREPIEKNYRLKLLDMAQTILRIMYKLRC